MTDDSQRLRDLLRRGKQIRAIGFDDAPFERGAGAPVGVAGVVCSATRFDGMVWGYVEQDGWDATDVICELLLDGKFLPQLHVLLLDGIALGGFNVVDMPRLVERLGIACAAVMRRFPDFDAVEAALEQVGDADRRLETMRRGGPIHHDAPFYYQVQGADPKVMGRVLHAITDRGHVPEALRLAHLIGSAFVTGESGRRA